MKQENLIQDKKILIVEDDPVNLSVMKIMLKPIYKLDIARNGEKAIELAKENHYDLFLMDINLGAGMDGLSATKIFRKMDIYCQTPIIATTAYAMYGDRENFIEAGCTDYIAKPFTKEVLLNLITHCLQ